MGMVATLSWYGLFFVEVFEIMPSSLQNLYLHRLRSWEVLEREPDYGLMLPFLIAVNDAKSWDSFEVNELARKEWKVVKYPI